MVRFLKTSLLLLIVIAGVWLLLNRDQIERPQDVIRLAQQKIASFQNDRKESVSLRLPPQFESVDTISRHTKIPSVQDSHRKPRTSLRVATLKIQSVASQSFDATGFILADICRRYDVIALQGLNSVGANSGASIVEQMNSIEASDSNSFRPYYRLLTDQPNSDATQLAIIYDEAAVLLDEDRWYRVRDPDQILSHQPLVAWFRARGVPNEQAFTFSLANVQFDSQRPDRELRYLSELFRAIRDDGRGEDDVIIAGNFNSGDRGLATIRQKSGLTWVVSGMPTDTNRTAQFDNVVFNPAATVEFTKRGGVFDFLKHYNLTLSDAHRVSTHLPVWAEFNLQEGNASPAVATQNQPARF